MSIDLSLSQERCLHRCSGFFRLEPISSSVVHFFVRQLSEQPITLKTRAEHGREESKPDEIGDDTRASDRKDQLKEITQYYSQYEKEFRYTFVFKGMQQKFYTM